jgi:asparagine synthase (glutamine-hydrolysing)
MAFSGNFNLNKPIFIIKTIKKPFSQNNKKIYLFGNITDIFSDSYKLDKYKNKQEELISEIYEKEGEKFIKLLEGYFLIILHDKEKNIFYVFNNRYSNTTCYYTIKENKILFSDQLKDLIKNLDDKKPDFEVINLFLNCGYSYSHKMPVKGIERLVPGHFIKIIDGKIEVKRYSKMNFKRKPVKNLKKALDKYGYLWKDALKNFFEYNNSKKVGSALSGGMDTSYVVCMASKVHNKPIHTYTCHYQYNLFNEMKRAKFVTKKCNGIQHRTIVTEKDLDLLPEIIRTAEEPILASSLSLYKVIKQSSNKVDTFLTGDGGNNIYHHLYPVSEIHRYVKYLPHTIRKPLYHFVNFIAKITGQENLWELKHVLHAFSYKNFYDDFYKNLVSYRHFGQYERKRLLKKEFRKEPKDKDMLGYIPITRKNFDNALIENRFVHGNMEYVTTFHEKFVKKYNMKVFPPYQSKKLMDFICSLPFNLLYKGNTFKRITNKVYKMYFHRMALKRHFPAKFVDEGGQSFDQPFHGWFEKRPEVVKLLFKRLKKRGWYNKKYLDKLYKEHKRQYQHEKIVCQLQNNAYRIMALLCLEIWCMEFLDKEPNRERIEKVSLEKYLAQK